MTIVELASLMERIETEGECNVSLSRAARGMLALHTVRDFDSAPQYHTLTPLAAEFLDDADPEIVAELLLAQIRDRVR